MERVQQPACGPLTGFRIIEFAGIGPAPFAGMLLADLGADVIMIDRLAGANAGYPRMALNRGKRSVALDLKSDAGRALAWELLANADALIEGFRPGVMERLGFGPEAIAERHPRLVYGRMTGWGQTGPLAQSAGHDINYVALTGALSLAARPGAVPSIPPTFIGDMGGGAMFLVMGVLAALLDAQRSGRGQVIDAAIVDGTALLASLIHSMRGIGAWVDDPARNFFSHTSPFYEVFECADGKHVTLGAIEPQFYAQLLDRLGLADVDPSRQYDSRAWPELKARIAALIRTQDRAYWCSLLLGTDACFAPVLDLDEAAEHEHNRARGVFVDVDGKRQPAPAPRFSRTPARAPAAGPLVGEHTSALLRELGHSEEEVAGLRARGACA
jgi:alpha-methylacyl-CoA racemase